MKVDSIGTALIQAVKNERGIDNNQKDNKGFIEKMNQCSLPEQTNKKYSYTIRVEKPYIEPNYTTMEDTEIYNAIVDEFKNKYGDNFLEHHILHISPTSYEQADIVSKFFLKLEQYLGDNYKSVARTAQYGDMTETEVRLEIAKKYNYSSMTLRDFMHMSYEMHCVGVDIGLWNLGESMWSSPNGKYFSGTQEAKNENFSQMLDKPLNINAMMVNANGMKFANNPSCSNLLFDFLSNYFNLRIGNDGYLLTNN